LASKGVPAESVPVFAREIHVLRIARQVVYTYSAACTQPAARTCMGDPEIMRVFICLRGVYTTTPYSSKNLEINAHRVCLNFNSRMVTASHIRDTDTRVAAHVPHATHNHVTTNSRPSFPSTLYLCVPSTSYPCPLLMANASSWTFRSSRAGAITRPAKDPDAQSHDRCTPGRLGASTSPR
jgi:hypothetical protein